MATPKDKYYTKLLKTLVDESNRNSAPLSNENIQQAVSIVMEETEAELKRDINEITMDTSFKSPVQKKYISTIIEYGYYESEDRVANHITNGIKKLLISQIPVSFEPVVIRQDLFTRF